MDDLTKGFEAFMEREHETIWAEGFEPSNNEVRMILKLAFAAGGMYMADLAERIMRGEHDD